jgi:hypothetical protein
MRAHGPVLFARCSVDEHLLVKRLAQRDGLSMSNFIRHCINSVILEEGDDSIPLLEPAAQQRGRPRKERL